MLFVCCLRYFGLLSIISSSVLPFFSHSVLARVKYVKTFSMIHIICKDQCFFSFSSALLRRYFFLSLSLSLQVTHAFSVSLNHEWHNYVAPRLLHLSHSSSLSFVLVTTPRTLNNYLIIPFLNIGILVVWIIKQNIERKRLNGNKFQIRLSCVKKSYILKVEYALNIEKNTLCINL